MYEFRPSGEPSPNENNTIAQNNAQGQSNGQQDFSSNVGKNPYYGAMQYVRGGAPYTPPPAPKPIYRRKDTLFAYLSIILGFFFVRALPLSKTPLSAMLAVLLLFLFGAVFLTVSKVRLTPAVIILAGSAAILSVGLLTGGNNVIRGFLFTVLIVLFLCFLYAACGLAGKNLLSDGIFSHVWNAVFVIPLTSLYHLFPALPIHFKKGESSERVVRGIGWTMLGLCVAILPTAIVIALLSYDAQFTALLGDLFDFSLDGVWEYIGDAILGFIVAIPLFGALFGANWKRERNNEDAEVVGKTNLRILPRPLVIASVTPLLFVCVLFFISQWSYYVSAFTHVLPGDLTYAAYAREGFFELCWVAAINALLLLLFNLLIRPSKNEKFDLLRSLYSTVISLFTLILIATALSKMMLYIDSYGLTQKRVYASWLMLLLAAVFVLVIVRQFVRRMPLAGSIAVCGILFFALIALPNIDGMIANYNVDAYLSGKLPTVDVESISDYGISSVPALCKLEDALDEREKPTGEEQGNLLLARTALSKTAADLSKKDYSVWSFNFPESRARRLLTENGYLK